MSTVVLKGLVGSHAYGYATEASDQDWMSVYVADLDNYFGTYSKKSGSSMYKKYCSEYPSFRQALYNSFPNHPYNDRIEHLWKVLEECSNQ
jgi:predicted nucleotidyltransferase